MVEQLSKIKENFKEFINSNSEMKKRILSSIVLIPVVLLSLAIKQLFLLSIFFIAILMAFEWITITNSKTQDNIWKLLGVVYISMPTFSLIYIRNSENGFDITLYLLLIVWTTDICAMLTGKHFGGPKLTSISPKKTWSGLIGGVVASILLGSVLSMFFKASITFFAIFSGILAIIEQASDILESKFKRIFEVKDSGNIIPGHGGIMDRIDGLTLTAPLISLIIIFSSNIF